LSTLVFADPQSASSSKSQRAEAFRLTMPGIRATFAAYTDFATLLGSDPVLAAKFKSVKKSLPDTNGRDTLGLAAAKLLTEPRVAAVFARNGITPAQTTETFETLIGVIFGSAMLDSVKPDSGKGDTAKLPAFVAENMAFYKQNKTEIDQAFKTFAANAGTAGKKALEDDKDEDEEQEDDEK
jgi:hypothetical protein